MSYVVGSLEDGKPFLWPDTSKPVPTGWRLQQPPPNADMWMPRIEPIPGYVPPGGWKQTPSTPDPTPPPAPAPGGMSADAREGERRASSWVMPAIFGGLVVLFLRRRS